MTAPLVPLLGGRYAVGPVIGVGGMAEVHEGTDVRLGRRVALKVLRRELARDPAFQLRFRREAQAAASLDAASIVAVYDTVEDADGVPFIVMELVEGRTLREVLQTGGRLPPERALEVVADVCDALQVAHDAGIVHRDVKPGNVMLTDAGEVKVMDFGIARAVADAALTMTQTAAVIGTAAYLSPEQARGDHVDTRSDLYSAGCLLYELLTGVPPFTGDSPLAVAYQHVREDPVPPSGHERGLSADVDAVVLQAMAKGPQARYQTASLMRDDLLRAAAGQPVQAVAPVVERVGALPAETVLRPQAGTGGRRALAYTLFGLLLVAVAVAVALVVRGLAASSSSLVAAPEVVGLTQEQAVDALAGRGLRVGDVTPRFAERPAGTVLSQSPTNGLLVRREGPVDLVVSQGVDLTRVPPVVGLDRAQALTSLSQLRLGVGKVVPRDGNVPPGQVLEVEPPAGQPVRAGGTVGLVVASGRVPVPDVRGRAQDDAVQLLRKAGLSVAVQPRQDPGPVGTVLAQTPAGGVADRSSVVTVTVALAPPPPSPAPSPSPSPSLSPTPTGSPSPRPLPTPLPTG